ncbi:MULTISPECIES: thiamine-phosphate kinase [unclassified Moraxella]|uniref:thiamine-phosphate kinase n=1 Tax=unclassified Moraxella TaxID=2685852 RepID=UPI003AF98CB8
MSEFSLIYQHFKNATARHPMTKTGIGDDCAVSRIPLNAELISCVDVLVAGRHFPLSTSAYAIGYKSVAVNLSDLASMGATPYAILLGISLPKPLANDDWLSKFAQGIADCCQPFGVELIGGDTTGSEVLTISVTALGFVPQGQAILRSGAKVGDVICVSGDIGNASFALQQIFAQEESESRGVLNTPLQNVLLQQSLDLPQPQVALGQKLRGFANSMIDISDGLGQDLGHMLQASSVGAKVYLDKIPTHPILQNLPNLEKWQHQMNGGDDYQLCFTLSKDNFERFNQRYPNEIFAIGEIVTDKGLALLYDGEMVDFDINGWQHF